MKYSIKNGQFVSKENNEQVNSLSGKFTGIHVVKPENGVEMLQIDLTVETEEGPSVNTISMRKLGDASLKVLRCLYSIADIITGKTLTISFEAREGKSSLINVSADNQTLLAAGVVEPYAADKKLLTDKIISTLMWSFKFETPVLVFTCDDNVLPETADETASYILEMRRSGRSNELSVKKTVFNNQKAASGYLQALRDIGRGFTCFRENEDIDIIMRAWESPLDEDVPVADANADVDNGHEEEY